MIGCAVTGCKNTYEKVKKLKLPIVFHRFPKEENLRIEWIKKCGRTRFAAKYSAICSEHFQDTDYEQPFNYDLYFELTGNKPRKTLKKTAIPSKNVHLNIIGGVIGDIIEEDPDLTSSTTPEVKEEIIVDFLPDSAAPDVKVLLDKEINRLCRICLEEKETMWLFSSIITFDDGTTFDIPQVFKKLTGEEMQKIENPKLPPNICQQCTDLLVNAYHFKNIYKKSSEILNSYLLQDDLKQPSQAPANVNPDNLNSEVEEVLWLEEIEPEEMETEEVKLHKCPICPKEFTAVELKKHCRTHEALKSYFSAAPKYRSKLKFYARPRDNIGLFSQEKIYHTCWFCQEDFDSDAFQTHIVQHKVEGNYKCNKCNRIFWGLNHLNMHKLSHKKETPYNCQYCNKGFVQEQNFNFHLLKHTKKQADLPFKCEECQQTFANPEHLKRHSFVHQKNLTYNDFYKRRNRVKCKKCLQPFSTQEQFEAHWCRLSCAKCQKIFETKKEFNNHVCRQKLKLRKCLPCGKVFKLQSTSMMHKYRCTSAKDKSLCYVCGKNVVAIQNHMYTHFPNKKRKLLPAKCPECNKMFAYKQSMMRHVELVHRGLTPFTCQYCSKQFKTKWSVDMHEKIHTGEKNHVCHLCDRRFLEKSTLRKHLNVHAKNSGLEA